MPPQGFAIMTTSRMRIFGDRPRMIDLERIRQERTAKRIIIELLINAPQLFFILYGLKCLVFLRGKMLISVQGVVYSSSHLVAVGETVAATVGLAYIGFGLFLYLSDGHPPGESYSWLRQIGRALLRWGSLAVAIVCYLQAAKIVTGVRLDLAGLPLELLIKTAGFIAGLITLLSFLSAMFQREQVKQELFNRGCAPLHIWWRPAAYWMCRYWFTWWYPTGFRVIYSDPSGLIHKGYCFVYRSFLQDWQWGNRRVQWLADTVTCPSATTEVWADIEIILPKLPEKESSDEASDLLDKPDEPD